MSTFDGKVALVTGGGRGFGKRFAEALAGEGAAVVIADVDAAAAVATVGELTSSGAKALALDCDVAREADVARAVDAAVGDFGRLDILLNNAGRHLSKYNQPFGALTHEDIRAVFDVNIMGVVNCSLACRGPMRDSGGGAIVNIASISGHMPTSPYGVSKLAVRGLTMAFATEFAADGIRVNAVSPGLMATEAALADLPREGIEELVNKRQLLHRIGTMDDVLAAVLFLCGGGSSFITGETILVSGGYPLAL